MTDNNHPITPSRELIQQWRCAASNVPASLCTDPGGRRDYIDYIATQATRWGADVELEACCAWAQGYAECGDLLRVARRPQPKSLAEEALAVLDDTCNRLDAAHENVLRRALERLQELEEQGDD